MVLSVLWKNTQISSLVIFTFLEVSIRKHQKEIDSAFSPISPTHTEFMFTWSKGHTIFQIIAERHSESFRPPEKYLYFVFSRVICVSPNRFFLKRSFQATCCCLVFWQFDWLKLSSGEVRAGLQPQGHTQQGLIDKLIVKVCQGKEISFASCVSVS